jgi:hypothetical protein
MLERLGLERELSDLGIGNGGRWSPPQLPPQSAAFDLRGVNGARFEYEAARANAGPFAELSPSERKAIQYTTWLETGKPFGLSGATGNFDGYGVSFGALQWNIKAGSLQPLLRQFLQRFPERWEAIFGADAAEFRRILELGSSKQAIAAQQAYAVGTMNTRSTRKDPKSNKEKVVWKLRPEWSARFEALSREPGFQRIQVDKVREMLRRAADYCQKLGFVSERAFVLSFDATAWPGPYWYKKFEKTYRAKVAAAEALRGPLPEREKLGILADIFGAAASERWRANAHARKRAIVDGVKYKWIDVKALGVGDQPYTLSSGAGSHTTATASQPVTTGVGSNGRSSSASPAPTSSSGAPSNGAAHTNGTASSVFSALGAAVGTAMTAVLGSANDALLARIAPAHDFDPGRLATELFYARHPDRGRAPIAPGDKASIAEWWSLREGAVASWLERHRAKARPAGTELRPYAVVSRYGLRNVTKALRPAGVVVHTTSGGYARKARTSSRTALDMTLGYYVTGKEGFPHYVIHYDGTLFATQSEDRTAWHAGYGKGSVRGKVPNAWWSAAWGPRGFKHPLELLPNGASSPNQVHIGVELLADTSGWGFTDAQYATLARLVRDLSARWGFAVDQVPGRALLGHEDVNPWERTDGKGRPWDPGGHRTPATFDWGKVARLLGSSRDEEHEFAI